MGLRSMGAAASASSSSTRPRHSRTPRFGGPPVVSPRGLFRGFGDVFLRISQAESLVIQTGSHGPGPVETLCFVRVDSSLQGESHQQAKSKGYERHGHCYPQGDLAANAQAPEPDHNCPNDHYPPPCWGWQTNCASVTRLQAGPAPSPLPPNCSIRESPIRVRAPRSEG